MFLAIDIGNSNIVIALHDGKDWINTFRYESKDNQAQLYYERGLVDILLEWGVAKSAVLKVGISSVVPSLNDRIYQAAYRVLGIKPMFVTPEVIADLDMHVAKPREIGSDLVCNAYAAISIYGKNTIVVDFGTALTFTVVSVVNGIMGVTIAPGIYTGIAALSGNTAQLPVVQLSKPRSAIGTSTVTAIQAGIVYGYTGMVKEIVAVIQAELSPEQYQVVATGGLSHFTALLENTIDEVDKNLTLEGLRLIAFRF